jgi:hypothetical protein
VICDEGFVFEMSNTSELNAKPMFWGDIARVSFGILAIIACLFLILDCGRSGFSRFLSMLAIIQSNVEAADHAVAIAPTDPEAHYTRALSLVNAERLDEARGELTETTRLRPYHYYEWLDLGVTLDRLGDYSGAENALRTSISLAPSFAQPHWQLGNLLYRAGRYDEAFEDLRLAAQSNSNLTEGLLRLAWVSANGDVARFLTMIKPVSKAEHVVAARFLSAQGRGAEAVAQVRAAGEASTLEQRDLLKQSIQQLISAHDFASAFEIWRLTHTNINTDARVINGDFVGSIPRDDPGFGWQLLDVANVSFAIDTAGPDPSARSLRIEFSGDSPPLIPLVNQLLLLEPGKRYSLSFMAKTESLISGGRPLISAVSGTNDQPKILGQSTPIMVGTTTWASYHFEFWADDATPAVNVILQREACDKTPCPAFGQLWVSRFSLNRP